MKIHKTKTLFFKKYPYKVELKCKGIRLIPIYGFNRVQEFCVSNRNKWNYTEYSDQEKSNLLEFLLLFQPYIKSNHKQRKESNTISFYLENKDDCDEICNHFGKWVESKTEPTCDSDLEKLFSKNYIVVCDKLPHSEFVYKLQLTNKMAEHQREKFFEWLKSYENNIVLPESTMRWLTGHRWWCEPYMYVRDQKTLVMLQLYLGDNVKRTYEFVLRDTAINTVSEDELCQL